MARCFVPFCDHRSGSTICSLHEFPSSRITLHKWIKNIRRADRMPTKHSRVCSCHFIEKNPKKYDVPTVFKWNVEKQYNTVASSSPSVRKRNTAVVATEQAHIRTKGISERKSSLKHQAKRSAALFSASPEKKKQRNEYRKSLGRVEASSQSDRKLSGAVVATGSAITPTKHSTEGKSPVKHRSAKFFFPSPKKQKQRKEYRKSTIAPTSDDTATISTTGDDAEAVSMTGDAAGAVSMTGDDAGAVSMTGDDAEAVSMTGDAAGAVSMTGDDAGAVSMTGDDAGAVSMTSDDTATISTTGDDAEAVSMTGDDAGAVSMTGDDAGTVLTVCSGVSILTEQGKDRTCDEHENRTCDEQEHLQYIIVQIPEQEVAPTQLSFGVHSLPTDKLMIHYTGVQIESFKIITELCQAVKFNYVLGYKPSMITFENQVLLTLMKLRLNLTNIDLGMRFCISESGVSNIFRTILVVLHVCLYKKLMDSIPSRAKNMCSLPAVFSPFPNCRAVFDCTEFKCEKPLSLHEQKLMYSSYKHMHTVKALIVVAPNGVITYVSNAYPGSTSDKAVVEHCEILKQMEQGDLILADKGFLLDDILPEGVSASIPPFRGTSQFTPSEVAQGRKISKARIHVERAIGRLKCYRILSFLTRKMYPITSQIIQTCAALTNFRSPLIKEVSHLYRATMSSTPAANATELTAEEENSDVDEPLPMEEIDLDVDGLLLDS